MSERVVWLLVSGSWSRPGFGSAAVWRCLRNDWYRHGPCENALAVLEPRPTRGLGPTEGPRPINLVSGILGRWGSAGLFFL